MEALSVIVVSDFGAIHGGLDRVVVESLLEQAEFYGSIDFLTAVGPVDERILDEERIKTSFLDCPDLLNDPSRIQALLRGIWNRSAYRELRRLIRLRKDEGKSVVVHVHSFTKALSMSVFAAARAEGIPVILTLHDYFVFSPNGIHYDFRKEREITGSGTSLANLLINRDRRNIFHHYYRGFRTVLQRLLRLTNGKHIRFIAISESSAAFAANSIPKKRISIIRYPFYVPDFSACEVSQNRPVGYIGRISHDKGVFEIAEALEALDVPFHIIGDGPAKEELLTRFPNVRCTGWIDSEKVGDEIRNLRMVVLNSRWHETYGLVVPEAMCHGVPVAVSMKAGSSELVEDGVNGILLPDCNTERMSEILKPVLNDEWVTKAGKAAWDTVRAQDHSFITYLDACNDYYKMALVANAS